MEKYGGGVGDVLEEGLADADGVGVGSDVVVVAVEVDCVDGSYGAAGGGEAV